MRNTPGNMGQWVYLYVQYDKICNKKKYVPIRMKNNSNPDDTQAKQETKILKTKINNRWYEEDILLLLLFILFYFVFLFIYFDCLNKILITTWLQIIEAWKPIYGK